MMVAKHADMIPRLDDGSRVVAGAAHQGQDDFGTKSRLAGQQGNQLGNGHGHGWCRTGRMGGERRRRRRRHRRRRWKGDTRTVAGIGIRGDINHVAGRSSCSCWRGRGLRLDIVGIFAFRRTRTTRDVCWPHETRRTHFKKTPWRLDKNMACKR